jgi:hypothetical protein
MNSEIVSRAYNAFKLQPLEPGDPVYVDCRSVRGDQDVWQELGTTIFMADEPTCQLYTGHRGVGKSTELRILRQKLEDLGYCVVYFEADEADIEPEDTQYTDILLACTRHVLERLRQESDPQPLLGWLRERWGALKDLALTEIEFDKLSVDLQIAQFAKLTANLRAVPNLRRQIREQVDSYSVSLVEALNEFIESAKRNLPSDCRGVVVIIDNLDRMVPTPVEGGRSNHQQIFLDRSEQLQGIHCHLVYTIPISMVHSSDGPQLEDRYGKPRVLPMIMVRMPDSTVYDPGVDKLKELIKERFQKVDPTLTQNLDTLAFDEAETLKNLCLMSGGHVRNLLYLLQEAIKYEQQLPISGRAIRRSFTEARDTYRTSISAEDWQILAKVAHCKNINNDRVHHRLLANRCILEYRYMNEQEEVLRWWDVHPLIRGIEEFQTALQPLMGSSSP